MSLNRTALRLAAAMALSNGYAAPYPTMAGDRVFDSRQDPIEGLKHGDLLPVLVLYTDDDTGETLSQNNGGPPFDLRTNLVIEISVAMWIEEGGEAGLTMVQSEPELDAQLDLFEAQIKRVFRDGMSTWGAELDKVINRVERWSSTRFIERESNTRFAARQLQISVRLADDEDPEAVVSPATASPVIPAPLGPLLEAIIDDDGPFAATATALQEMLTGASGMTPIVLPALERVRFIEAAQAVEDEGGTPRGPRPDGVAQANLPNP